MITLDNGIVKCLLKSVNHRCNNFHGVHLSTLHRKWNFRHDSLLNSDTSIGPSIYWMIFRHSICQIKFIHKRKWANGVTCTIKVHYVNGHVWVDYPIPIMLRRIHFFSCWDPEEGPDLCILM